MLKNWINAIFVITAGMLFLPTPSAGQAIHIPPAYRIVLPSDKPVLEIALPVDPPAETIPLPEGTAVLVQDNQLILIVPQKGRDIIPFGNRTIGDVADALQAKYPSQLRVTAFYPLYPAHHIGDIENPDTITETHPVRILTSGGQPTVAIGFGIVFAMANDDIQQNDGGLLSQTGFQLDLTGVHQFIGPRNTSSTHSQTGEQQEPQRGSSRPWIIPQLYLQARLGLNADQSLNVVTTDSLPNDDDDTGTQFQDAVEQADQIALTGQLEAVYRFRGGKAEFSLVPEYGVTWTRVQEFQFPLITVNRDSVDEALVDVSEVFDERLVARASERLNQTIPLTNYGASVVLRFISGGRPVFYVGGGYLHRQVIHRGIRYRRLSTTREPDPNSLTPDVDAIFHGHWRGMFGARIPGVIDVRVDAVTPISGEVGVPLLRLVLAKDFPLVR